MVTRESGPHLGFFSTKMFFFLILRFSKNPIFYDQNEIWGAPKFPNLKNLEKNQKIEKRRGFIKKVNHRSFRKVFCLFRKNFWYTLMTNRTLNLHGSFVSEKMPIFKTLNKSRRQNLPKNRPKFTPKKLLQIQKPKIFKTVQKFF